MADKSRWPHDALLHAWWVEPGRLLAGRSALSNNSRVGMPWTWWCSAVGPHRPQAGLLFVMASKGPSAQRQSDRISYESAFIAYPQFLRYRQACPTGTARIRSELARAEKADPATALTHLRAVLDDVGGLIDETLADVVVDAELSLRAAAEKVGLTENAIGPRLAKLVYHRVPVGEVPALNLQPRGATALLDAMGTLITDTAAQLDATPEVERPGTVIVAIMTDGHENSSREWTHPAITNLVEQQTRHGWEFLYMAATSANISRHRAAKMQNPAAVMDAYSGEQRADVADG